MTPLGPRLYWRVPDRRHLHLEVPQSRQQPAPGERRKALVPTQQVAQPLQVLLQAPILPVTVQDLHCPTDEEPRQQGQSRLGEGGAQSQGRGPGVLQVPRACLAKAGARRA